MALTPLSKEKKNRILRNIGLVFLMQDITLLDKYGYKFIHICSGFIAHYNRTGFIAHYGNSKNLAADILRNQASNQWNNFSPSDKDYEYMMQKKEMYNLICEYAKQNFDSIPPEEETFKPPKIKDMFDEEPGWRKSVEKAYSNHIAFGNYFNTNDPQRVVDLADITMAYNAKVVNGTGRDRMTDDDFLRSEITTDKGMTGTPEELLNCYRDEIWYIFNHFSGRAFELGIEDPLAEEEDE